MIEALPFERSAAGAWDELVDRAPMATFLHSRRFLSYHGERFRDVSVLIRDGKQLVGVLPAAADPDDPARAVSHPGATFSGIVHEGALAGEAMVEALGAAAALLAERGFGTLVYRAVPYIYHQRPSADDLYGLFRHRAARARVDLSCAIDLQSRGRPSSRRRRGYKKARSSGLDVIEGAALAEKLWPVVEENLARRYGVRPVHTLAEILLLHELFPDQIRFVTGALDGEVVAGVVLFHTPRVVHAQYIASSDPGRRVGALDAVFEHCIDDARSAGVRYFDFGTSNERGGWVLNAGLYRFKLEFGGGGVAYEVYELPCGVGQPA